MLITQTTTSSLTTINAKLWIVLVGVNQYLDINIPNLNYCANDCQKLAEILAIVTAQSFGETEIISIYNGGKIPPQLSQITTNIEKFKLAKPDDTVLFYFSGHGYLDKNNRPVLCVKDTVLRDLENTALKLDFVLQILNQCPAQKQLVWLDACQENHSSDRNPATELLNTLNQQAQQHSHNFHAMLSCNQQERSWEISTLQHGLFTYCLIEGLKGKASNSEGIISAESLFTHVAQSCPKLISYYKNSHHSIKSLKIPPLEEVTTSDDSQTTQIDRGIPQNASQTPRKAVASDGEKLIIGVATPSVSRKALVIDKLSSSLFDIPLCRVLQSKGSFEVDYCFLEDNRQINLEQRISKYLTNTDNVTVILYLAGKIESTENQNYQLVFNEDNRLNLNWLGKQLETSLVPEIIVIADIVDTNNTAKSLTEIFQPKYDYAPCLITAITSQPHEQKFLQQLTHILKTKAQSDSELWIIDLITELQKWTNQQSDIILKPYLSGSTGIIEILSMARQRYYNDRFFLDVCPYKSLKAFTQDDAYFFHGRDELVAEIISELTIHNFVTVVGASGSGKSSVVRAGVVPRLLDRGLYSPKLQQSQSCQTWVMLPGENPLSSLAQSLAPDNPDVLEGILHLGVDSWVAWLRQQPQPMSVLIIDQFEELFHSIDDKKEKERLDFIQLILGAIDRASDCLKVIITLRVDFLDECLAIEKLADVVKQSQVLVPSHRLKDKQYEEIIALPTLKIGFEVENTLMKTLLKQLKTASLPLLQYALEELWQQCRTKGKLTLTDYQLHIGELGTFLGNKAQETYDNLTPVEQECVEDIFLRLAFLAKVDDEEKKDTRRRLLKSDLRVGKYKDVLDSTLRALVEARLLVVSGEDSSLTLVNSSDSKQNDSNKDRVTVEIAHEILFRDWESLKWWLEKNREKYRIIREIDREANKWKNNVKLDGFLLSKGALVKYNESNIDYANDLSHLSQEFIYSSVKARKKEEKLATRRRRQIIGGLTGGIVAISIVAVTALWQWQKSTINEINALTNSAEALLASNQEFDALLIGLKASKLIKNSVFPISKITKTKLVIELQNVFYQVREFNTLKGHKVKFSPNNQIIASSSEHGTIEIWSFEGVLLHSFPGHKKWISVLEFSPDSQTLASASTDGTVKLWSLKGDLRNLENKPLYSHKSHQEQVNDIKFSFDGQIVASCSRDGSIKLWNFKEKKLYTLEQGHKDYVMQIKFNPNGQTLASASADGTVKLWNYIDNSFLNVINHNNWVNSLQFSSDGQTIASASRDGIIKIWNLKKNEVHSWKGHTDDIFRLEFSPDDRIIASASFDNTVKLWDLEGNLINSLEEHQDRVYSVKFNPNGEILSSASSDNTVKIWDLEGNLIDSLEAHKHDVYSIDFSRDGKTLASASRDDTIKIWKLKGILAENYSSNNHNLKAVKFNKNSYLIATLNTDGLVGLWNILNKLPNSFDGEISQVERVIFDSKNQIISLTILDSKLQSFNIQGKLINFLPTNQKSIQIVAFSPDGQNLVSVNSKGKIEIWNIDGILIKTLVEDISSEINDLTFSPNGKTIVFANNDGSISFLSLHNKKVNSYKQHIGDVWSVKFNPDGKLIASSSSDATIKLWNTDGTIIKTLKDHTDAVNEVMFSPDGKLIASASNDGTVKLWNVDGILINTFVGHTRQNVKKVVFTDDSQTLTSVSESSIVRSWSLDLDEVMIRGCSWVRDYLENNPNVSEKDRKMCDGIGNE